MPLSRPVPYQPLWVQESTSLNVDNVDTMDYGILHAYYQSEAMWLVNGAYEDFTYSGDNITQVDLKNSANQTLRRVSMTYTGADITRVDYYVYDPAQPGLLVTWLHYYDTFTYSSGDVTRVTRTVVATPTGGA